MQCEPIGHRARRAGIRPPLAARRRFTRTAVYRERDQRRAALWRIEADEFYDTVTPQDLSADARNVMRQSFAGLLWSKQFYHYVIKDWLKGDPDYPPPPDERHYGRNHEWRHLYNADVISMPDKW